MAALSKKQEAKLIESIEDRIREADEYFRDEEDVTDKEIDAYISALKWAIIKIKEHDYMWED